MPNPVSYFEIGGRDAAGLRKFYADLFEWSVEPFGAPAAGDDYFHIEPQENGIAGGVMQITDDMRTANGMPMPPGYVTVYVSVDDLQAHLDKAESLGGSTVVPPTPIPNDMGSIALFADPQGNVIGLHKF